MLFEKQEVLSSETGMLKNKTRILATHSISFLPNVDRIVVMKDGAVDAQGTYQELMDRGGSFAEFINEHSTSQNEGNEEETKDEPTIDNVSFFILPMFLKLLIVSCYNNLQQFLKIVTK